MRHRSTRLSDMNFAQRDAGTMTGQERTGWWVALIGLGLAVFSGRLVWVAAAATDVPYWDQWDAEAAQLFLPYLADGDWWAAIWRAHNEHYIVGSRLIAVGLLALNGQWDPLLEMVVGAGIAAGCSSVMLNVGRGLPAAGRWIWAGVLLLVGVLPFGWQNTLFGFQTQVYLMMFAGVVALRQATATRGVFAASLATAIALMAAFSMAGGLLLAVPLSLLALLNLWVSPRRPGAAAGLLAGSVVLVILGWVTRHEVPGHAFLRIDDYASFVAVFTTYLAWPLSPGWFWFIPMMGPVTILAARRWRDRRFEPAAAFALCICAWGASLAGTLAWSRGGQYPVGTEAPSRYLDMLVVVPLGNTLALLILVQDAAFTRMGSVIRPIAATWLAALVAAFSLTGFGAHGESMIAKLGDPTATARVVTGAERAGAVSPKMKELLEAQVFPSFTTLWDLLHNSHLRPVLPASLQPPLATTWRTDGGELRGTAIDQPGVPVHGVFYTSFVGRGPHRVERVQTEPYAVSSGGVICDVFVSAGAVGTIELRAMDGLWSWSRDFGEVTPSRWVALTAMPPAGCPVQLVITSESVAGGVVVSPPRWISRGSAAVRALLAARRGLVVLGVAVLSLGLLLSTPMAPVSPTNNHDGSSLPRDRRTC